MASFYFNDVIEYCFYAVFIVAILGFMIFKSFVIHILFTVSMIAFSHCVI